MFKSLLVLLFAIIILWQQKNTNGQLGQLGQSIKDTFAEFDLLTAAISDAENINSGGVSYVEEANTPAFYELKPYANLRNPFRIIFPERLKNFALIATIRITNKSDGYLFSIVNSLDTMVQFGLKLSQTQRNYMNVSLIYNDPHLSPLNLNIPFISFLLPFEQMKWVNFAIQMVDDRVSFYHSCIKIDERNISNEHKELIFESSSIFYLAQAGSILKGNFEGSIQFLKLYDYPEFVSIVCNKTNIAANSDNDFNDYSNENESPVLQAPPDFKNYGYRVTKGEKGDRGPKGSAGDSIRGPPGPPGPKGECEIIQVNNASNKIEHKIDVASCSCNLDNIMDILHNETVRSILRGPKGDEGVPGKIGLMGPPGTKGDKGEKGSDGIDGTPGLPGTPGENYEESMMSNIPGMRMKEAQKGEKGDMGMKGLKGESIKGEKGDPGLSAPIYPDAQNCSCSKGEKGLKGKRGKTGSQGVKGEMGVKGEKGESAQGFNAFGDEGLNYQKPILGTVTFQNTDSMIKQSSSHAVGTIAYVVDEEALLVKVNKGWQYIALGTLVPLTTQPYVTTSVSPTYSYGPVDFQASNLLNSNNILKSPESYTFTTPPEYESWNPKMLRLIALNEAYSGNLQGLRNADLNCHRQARRAGILGNFRAFLSTRIQNLDSLVKIEDRDLPITNLRGDVLFNSWNAIFNNAQGGFLSSPRILSFSGKNVMNDNNWPHKVVWHGAKADSIDSNCDGWHNSFPEKVGLGSSLLGNKLLAQEMYSCQQKNIVLCIEVLSHDSSNRRKRENFDDTYDIEKSML
ncbi:unnamed protein product [Chironomus riparius]|uniref:Thrombospondin-like N-terminal domain-containing protein n=1 Tax=Chironomus riparius TaxID=315576 RepID=A0A9P0IW98_9DIPT|nr:unnamed protein product [Chironomus riparius]